VSSDDQVIDWLTPTDEPCGNLDDLSTGSNGECLIG